MTLQIFPKHPDTDAYYVNGSYTPWAIVGRDKRFSDAELCAEFWRVSLRPSAIKPNPKGHGYIVRELGGTELSALARFAQLPHFDE